MKKIKYLFQRIVAMDHKAMFENVAEVHRRTGKNRIGIFINMIYVGIKFQAGYTEYIDFELYNLTNEQRATFVTRGVNTAYINKYNPREFWPVAENKIEFVKFFDGRHGRAWLDIHDTSEETFIQFFKKHGKIIAKPVDGLCGKGIEVFDYSPDTAQEIYHSIKDNNQRLVESYLTQHHIMSELYPSSVNTIRLMTIQHNGHVVICYGCIRVGSGGSQVDNLNSGGYAVGLDLQTGKTNTFGCRKGGADIEFHPDTHIPLKGFQVPYFEEAKALVTQAAKDLPNLGFLGWDVVLLEDGPILLEANQSPGSDIYQLPGMLEVKGQGLKPKFDRIFKEVFQTEL